MTRQEFIETVTWWDALLNFCYDEGYDIDIYTEEQRNEYIDDHLVDMARNSDTWEELLSELQNIPDWYDYYYRDEWGEWFEADHDLFVETKNEILGWMDDGGYWDDEPENDDEHVEDDDTFVETEEFSIDVLFSTCNNCLREIDEAKQKLSTEDNEAFVSLCVANSQ